MRVLLCAATSVEAKACEKGVRDANSKVQFEVLQTGMGVTRAEGALRDYLANHAKPDLIISTGFAGSRKAGLEVGSWLLADSVNSSTTQTSASISINTTEWAKRMRDAGISFENVALQTAAEVVGEKTNTPILAHVNAVDMESYALAKVAAEHRISFQVVRLVSDTPSRPIPDSIIQFTSGEGLAERSTNAARGLLSVAKSPGALARFIGQSMPLPAELARGWKKLASQMVFVFALASAVLVSISIRSTSAHALTIEQYLDEVQKSNDGYRSLEMDGSGGDASSRTSELMFKPQVFTKLQFTYDPRDTHSVELYGDHTMVKSVSTGFQEQTPWGLQLQLSMDYTQETLLGTTSPLITRPTTTNLYPVPIFNWSIWQNFGGRLDHANQRMMEAEARAKAIGASFGAKAALVEAEGRYWKLAALREANQIVSASLDRARSVMKVDQQKAHQSLIDSGDALLSESAVKGKELELKSIQTEEKSAARAFNSARGVDAEIVNDKLELPSPETFESWKLSERKGDRGDLRVAEQQAIASAAGYEMAEEKLRPNLSVFGSIFAMGLGFSMPLDQGLTSDAKEGYARQAQAAELQYRRKRFEQESEWSDLKTRFEDNIERLKLAMQLEAVQKKKFEDVSRRKKRGMTVAFQVFQYELDYLSAAQTRLQIQGELLGLRARARLYDDGEPAAPATGSTADVRSPSTSVSSTASSAPPADSKTLNAKTADIGGLQSEFAK